MSFRYQEFDYIANNVFAPIYPIIAEQIKDNTKVNEGKCVDIGSGAGYLAIPLAKITNLYMYIYDLSEGMIELAKENIIKNELSNRAEAICGDVHNMPFENESINLVISRGSVFFWENKIEAFKEINRILMPGGMAYIGGGFGSNELEEEIETKMCQINANWKTEHKSRVGNNDTEKYKDILRKAGINKFKILEDGKEFWITIKK